MIVNGLHIICNWRSNEVRALTRTELERFFDHRDPRDWIV